AEDLPKARHCRESVAGVAKALRLGILFFFSAYSMTRSVYASSVSAGAQFSAITRAAENSPLRACHLAIAERAREISLGYSTSGNSASERSSPRPANSTMIEARLCDRKMRSVFNSSVTHRAASKRPLRAQAAAIDARTFSLSP